MTAIAILLTSSLFCFFTFITALWLASKFLKLKPSTFSRAAALVLLITLLDTIMASPQLLLPPNFRILYAIPAFLLSPFRSIHLGPDDYFFLGDNSQDSYDSRKLVPFHKSNILGTVTLIYWPPNRMKILR